MPVRRPWGAHSRLDFKRAFASAAEGVEEVQASRGSARRRSAVTMTMPICARPRIAKCMARASVPRFWSGLFALGLCYCVQVSAKASSAAGIVLEQDGKPVPGAIVLSAGNREGFAPSFQRPGEGVLGITDSRGRWSLTNAPERLIITHPDYLRETVFAASEVTLLRNGIKLSGVVTDLSGRGIEGARILGGDFPLWTPSGGRFEFRNCRPGRMVLVAEAPGYAASWIEPATRDDTPELRWMLHPSIGERPCLGTGDGEQIRTAWCFGQMRRRGKSCAL